MLNAVWLSRAGAAVLAQDRKTVCDGRDVRQGWEKNTPGA